MKKKNIRIFTSKELELRNQGLKELKEIFDTLGLNFLLIDGVLLGAVREKNFIPWDWDVDLAIYPEKARPFIFKIADMAFQKEFQITHIDTSYENLTLRLVKYQTEFSLDGFYEKDDKRIRGETWLPKEFFTNIQTIEFLGNQYYCPSPPEKFLEHVYGDWKTPKMVSPSASMRSYMRKEMFLKKEFSFKIIRKKAIKRLIKYLSRWQC